MADDKSGTLHTPPNPLSSNPSVSFAELNSSDGQTLASNDGNSTNLQHSASTRKRVVPGMASRSVDLDDYFSGPLDPNKHSRIPFWMRMHGSITPQLIIPLLFVTIWTTTITTISMRAHKLAVDSVLLTVLGFVVALALSFRGSTAYERYSEGRKFWANLVHFSRLLAQHIWVYTKERPDHEKEDLLGKLTAINLINAFVISVKHRLRHEPEWDYRDLKDLIEHLDTFARKASVTDRTATSHNRSVEQRSALSRWGEYMGIPFFEENPRKLYKDAAKQGKHHGNLPYEIMTYLAQYMHHNVTNGLFTNAIMHTQVYNCLTALMDSYSGCERVLNTPLPVAYKITLSQVTWVYVLALPFQLVNKLGWVTIPATLVAAYIIQGFSAIGMEIENPFGTDVNDLDLDKYCQGLQYDLNILTSRPAHDSPHEWISDDFNKPLWPYSVSGFNSWEHRSVVDIRKALKKKIDHQAEGFKDVDHYGGSKRVVKSTEEVKEV